MRSLYAIALVGCIGLVGCGSETLTEGTRQTVLSTVRDQVSERFQPQAEPGALPPGLTRAAIADVKGPLLLAIVESSGGAATLQRVGQNPPNSSWFSPDGIGVNLNGQLLIATRGLGGDLLSADVSQSRARLSARQSGQARRVLRHLDGLDQIQREVFTCQINDLGAETVTVLEVNHATRHFREDCLGERGTSFGNDYWIGGGGTIWKSRQWIGKDLGYLGLQTLIN